MEPKITAWIARDKDGDLTLFAGDCPFKTDCDWTVINRDGTFIEELNKNSFPQVKWEDEEPTKVELTIKICK